VRAERRESGSEASRFAFGEWAHSGTSLPANQLKPLVWPDWFPPADWWGRFFTGIPLFGPSVSFFRHLEREQSSRTTRSMASWEDEREADVALKMGQCLLRRGWKTPYFIPTDQLQAVVSGPSFVSYSQQDLDYLLDEFNRRFERKLECLYLRSAVDWKDASVSFGHLVKKVSAELERKLAGGQRSNVNPLSA